MEQDIKTMIGETKMEQNRQNESHLIVKSDRVSAFLELGVIYVSLYVFMSVLNAVMVGKFDIKYFLTMFVILMALLLYAVKSAECKITFIEADEYRGARVVVEVGRRKFDITGIAADEFIIKQAGFEKKRNTARIRVKKYRLFLFGVSDIDKVRDFLDKHFQRNEKKKRK